ncbi:glycosyltransferase family 2 protein [Lentzea sp. NPDC058450]|uniref:glycosyltransferase family 2 protein n=1 Tax=Lentzea sp. NPDC058450 TaxID=3346505 RepID=UPI00364BB3FB
MSSVSVVIPVFNGAGVVGQCVASVAAQRLRPAEVIVVDDGSTDGSAAVARDALRASGIPFTVVEHGRNRGVAAARNTGLAACTSEWVWFVDSDDAADPRLLAALVVAAGAARADVAACRTRRVDEAGAVLGVEEGPWPGSWVPGPVAARWLLSNRMRAYVCTKLFRRELLPERWFPDRPAHEDFRPVLGVLLAAERVALVDEPLYDYTVRPGSLSESFGENVFGLLEVADEVGADLRAAGLARSWADDYLTYRYLNAVLPLANTALRAGPSPLGDHAVRLARGRTAWGDVVRLGLRGRWRLAAAAGVLKAAPRAYSAVLARR